MTLRVFVVDGRSEPAPRLATALGSLPELEVIGATGDGAEAVARATTLRPDVVVLDLDTIGIGAGTGIEATRDIVLRRPGIAVLALTGADGNDAVFAAMRAGARGCVHRDADPREIAAAVRTVAGGEVLCGVALADSVLAWFASAGDSPQGQVPELTDREREILELAAGGLATPAIAHRLFLPEASVRRHVSNVFMKLQVADRHAAVARAREAGAVD